MTFLMQTSTEENGKQHALKLDLKKNALSKTKNPHIGLVKMQVIELHPRWVELMGRNGWPPSILIHFILEEESRMPPSILLQVMRKEVMQYCDMLTRHQFSQSLINYHESNMRPNI